MSHLRRTEGVTALGKNVNVQTFASLQCSRLKQRGGRGGVEKRFISFVAELATRLVKLNVELRMFRHSDGSFFVLRSPGSKDNANETTSHGCLIALFGLNCLPLTHFGDCAY